MTIKEREIKKSKIHELVYINPFRGSCGLYPLIPVIMLFSTGHTIKVFNFASKYF